LDRRFDEKDREGYGPENGLKCPRKRLRWRRKKGGAGEEKKKMQKEKREKKKRKKAR